MNDLMRLPLGILTGVGFIGGGVILRRGDLVVGVTTAATLWYVTVVGLCVGGGQIGLGMAATAIGLFALWTLDWIEGRLRAEHSASLSVAIEGGRLTEDNIRDRLASAGFRVTRTRATALRPGARREFVFDVRAFRRVEDAGTPAVCDALASEEGVVKLEWRQ
jgi:putative Mg2+ transporter-C (MgtC) family protein